MTLFEFAVRLVLLLRCLCRAATVPGPVVVARAGPSAVTPAPAYSIFGLRQRAVVLIVVRGDDERRDRDRCVAREIN